jgi:hypothetical protein
MITRKPLSEEPEMRRLVDLLQEFPTGRAHALIDLLKSDNPDTLGATGLGTVQKESANENKGH